MSKSKEICCTYTVNMNGLCLKPGDASCSKCTRLRTKGGSAPQNFAWKQKRFCRWLLLKYSVDAMTYSWAATKLIKIFLRQSYPKKKFIDNIRINNTRRENKLIFLYPVKEHLHVCLKFPAFAGKICSRTRAARDCIICHKPSLAALGKIFQHAMSLIWSKTMTRKTCHKKDDFPFRHPRKQA